MSENATKEEVRSSSRSRIIAEWLAIISILIIALSFAISFVWEWGYWSAFGLSLAEIPMSIENLASSILAWFPALIWSAIAVVISILLIIPFGSMIIYFERRNKLSLKSRVKSLRHDMIQLENDTNTLKSDVDTLKNNPKSVKNNTVFLKLTDRSNSIKSRLRKFRRDRMKTERQLERTLKKRSGIMFFLVPILLIALLSLIQYYDQAIDYKLMWLIVLLIGNTASIFILEIKTNKISIISLIPFWVIMLGVYIYLDSREFAFSDATDSSTLAHLTISINGNAYDKKAIVLRTNHDFIFTYEENSKK